MKKGGCVENCVHSIRIEEINGKGGMAFFRGRKVPGLLGLSMLFSVGVTASERYDNNFHEEEEERVRIVDLNSLHFSVSVPYNGMEDNKVTEVLVGHDLIGDDLDPTVVCYKLNLLNQYILPAVEGSYELTKGVLRSLHNSPTKQDSVILYTKCLVEKLLDCYEYTNENVHTELADLNNHQAQGSKLSDEELKSVEAAFTSRDGQEINGLHVTGFQSFWRGP